METRRGRSRLHGLALTALLASTAAAQTPPARPTPFVERVEVNVRTVLVRITDKSGKAPSPPPAPQDISVLEDGTPMQVLGVDPARPPAALEAPPPVAVSRVTESAAPATAAPTSIGIPQHLYVDTTLLDTNSVTRLAATFEKSLDAVLANGPLEIVVADPQPRQVLASTRDERAIRPALVDLSKKVSGKQGLALLRRQTIDHMRNDLCPNLEMTTRTAAEQELRIVQDSLERLVRWAISLGGQRPDVVYLASDGFDSNVVETYNQVIRQAGTVGGNPLCAPADPNQVTATLQAEFAPKGEELVGSAARSLAALGVEAVPVALGGNFKDFGGDASTAGQDTFNAPTGTIPTFARPIEPLRTIAEATGGEVVTSPGRLPAVLEGYDSFFVVSFRSEHPPDGKAHDLRITTRRPGWEIRAPRYLAEGSRESAALGSTVRALHEAPAQGGIPVRLSIDGVAKSGKEYSGVLHVDADLATLVSTLDQLHGGRLAVTIAVQVEGAREPFTTKQEFDVPSKQAGWGADIPLTWPKKARRVAVTIEEQKTGARGTAAVAIPPAE